MRNCNLAMPAATIIGGYYLVTAARLLDAALALAISDHMPAESATAFSNAGRRAYRPGQQALCIAWGTREPFFSC